MRSDLLRWGIRVGRLVTGQGWISTGKAPVVAGAFRVDGVEEERGDALEDGGVGDVRGQPLRLAQTAGRLDGHRARSGHDRTAVRSLTRVSNAEGSIRQALPIFTTGNSPLRISLSMVARLTFSLSAAS